MIPEQRRNSQDSPRISDMLPWYVQLYRAGEMNEEELCQYAGAKLAAEEIRAKKGLPSNNHNTTQSFWDKCSEGPSELALAEHGMLSY